MILSQRSETLTARTPEGTSMTDWTTQAQTLVVSALTPVPPEVRDSVNQGPTDHQSHDRPFDELATLREVEVGGPPSSTPALTAPVRVMAWNVERLRHGEAIAATARQVGCDVILLSEVDDGMARTGNRKCIADFAEAVGQTYAYGVEFIELGLGDEEEARQSNGQGNLNGFHGNALLSRAALNAPFVIRVERRGDWFDGARGQRRIGSRMAIGARVMISGTEVLMVSVHLESHSGPQDRADEMGALLSAIDDIHPGGAVLLGGDFNTSTIIRTERETLTAKLAKDPMRLLRPHAYEPLFAVAAGFGYDWSACNRLDVSTVRHPAGSTRPPMKIDWFFTRGLVASDPSVIPAVLPDGSPSSDHEAIAVTIAPAGFVLD
jgi:endonuclease/exonuclease/phosphatase family metal-dependent hydrolase